MLLSQRRPLALARFALIGRAVLPDAVEVLRGPTGMAKSSHVVTLRHVNYSMRRNAHASQRRGERRG